MDRCNAVRTESSDNERKTLSDRAVYADFRMGICRKTENLKERGEKCTPDGFLKGQGRGVCFPGSLKARISASLKTTMESRLKHLSAS